MTSASDVFAQYASSAALYTTCADRRFLAQVHNHMHVLRIPHLHALMPETAHPQSKPISNAVPVAVYRIPPNVVLCPPAGLEWPYDLGYRSACVCSVPFLSCVVESCRRARVLIVYVSLACLTCSAVRKRSLYFFERNEPDSVRAELGRCARPGFASFQVLTRTLLCETHLVSISTSR